MNVAPKARTAFRLCFGSAFDSPWKSAVRRDSNRQAFGIHAVGVEKFFVNPTHEDFPSLLAEALDVLAGRNDDLAATSAILGCSTTQLVKLFKDEPRAFKALNDRREARGLHPLR